MVSTIIHPQMYQVATPVYEGPLDLLLQLIERAELDITKLALAQVTDQYLEHIQKLPELSAEEVSGFLVIAARLIQIKSEALLPRPPVREPGEEDPGEALARQLLIYRQYKRIAEGMDGRQKSGYHTYLRTITPPKFEGKVDMSSVSLADLVSAARYVFLQKNRSLLSGNFESVVAPPMVTIRQKISLIASLLRSKGNSTFRYLLGDACSRVEVVITFLAMLELVKLHFVKVQQDQIFGDIQLEPAEDWQTNEEIELEFGE
jgi:segregation and condensation protein A